LKIAYIGGIKSGKSSLAEQKALEMCSDFKPYYLATTELNDDDEMKQRVEKHKERRKDQFITIEEPLNIYDVIKSCNNIVLVECLTIWINNMLYYAKPNNEIFNCLTKVLLLNQSIIFVLNEVGLGIIPDNPLARQFIDISGAVSQLLGKHCNEVYFCSAGLSLKIK